MNDTLEFGDRAALTAHQWRRVRELLGSVLATNAFYRRKLGTAGIARLDDVRSLDDCRRLPFTTKAELSSDRDAHPPYGSNLTFPIERFTRWHQTSGTTGRPLAWLDTPESWQRMVASWVRTYRAAGIDAADRVFVAFSFGPYIGFWCAFEAAQQTGALVMSGAAMTSEQRVRCIVENDVTVLASTPTYALRLAEVAAGLGLRAADTSVRVTLHGGEPGAGIPATKRLIAEAWGARCFDHAGATEAGSWGFECGELAGLHIDESEHLFEVIDPATGQPASEGELVVTNLGRIGMPVIRYRTGDHVRLAPGPCPCGRTFARLDGGVIGRIDDVLIVRGVNVFPSALEDLVRRHRSVVEFAIEVSRPHALDELRVRLEVAGDAPRVCAEVAAAIRDALGLTAEVTAVAAGTLPRFESKARRVVDRRPAEPPSRP